MSNVLAKVKDIEKRVHAIKKTVAKQVQVVSGEREYLLQQIEGLSKDVNNKDMLSAKTDKELHSELEDKSKEMDVNKVLQKTKRFKSTVDKNTGNIKEMLTKLGSKQVEIVKRNKQIEHLKMKRDSIYDTGQPQETGREVYEEKIKLLEEEKDKLHEELVDYIIHDVVENKQEYEKTITELEKENDEMSGLIHHFHIVIKNLKDMNTALQYEMKILKENNEQLKYGGPVVEPQLHPVRSDSSLKSTVAWLQEQVILDTFLEQGIQDRDDMSGSMSISKTSVNENAEKDKEIELKKHGELCKRLNGEHHVMEMTECKMRMLRQHIMKEGMRKIHFLGSVDPRHRASVTSISSEDSTVFGTGH